MNFTILNLFNLPVFNIKPSESFKCNLVHLLTQEMAENNLNAQPDFVMSLFGLLFFFVLTSDNVLSFLQCDLLLDLTVTA